MSPGPQTRRGRITTAPAARATCSARAFVREYGALESGCSGAVSSTLTSGSPCISAASVPTWTKRGTPASRAAWTALAVPVTFTRSKSAALPHSPRCAAAWNATSAPRAPSVIAETSSRSPLTASAPSARTAFALFSLRARRVHGPALGHQALDQRAADEAGGAGDEGRAHRSRDATSSAGNERPAARSRIPRSFAYSRRSMTVDGVPGSSPPSRTSSAPSRRPAGRPARRRGSGPPGEVGAGLQDRPARRLRSSVSSVGTRRPSVSGSAPQASG